ncbi:unnamed protein product [Ectocarpus sp. 12 AP-2014]
MIRGVSSDVKYRPWSPPIPQWPGAAETQQGKRDYPRERTAKGKILARFPLSGARRSHVR